jgi:hypothetical protein
MGKAERRNAARSVPTIILCICTALVGTTLQRTRG